MTRAKDISKIITDADFSGTLDVTGDFTVDTNTLKVDSSNNYVGIGIASPSATLHLDASGGAFMKLERTGQGHLFLSTDGTNGSIRTSSASGALKFQTNGNNERMRIDSSGRVGIGTSSPSSFNSQADNLVVGTGSGANGITIYTDSTSSANIFFADGITGDDPTRGGINYNHSNNSMNFRVNDSPKMYILSSGNVGIGTSSPDTNLDVEGAGDCTISITANSTSNDSKIDFVQGSSIEGGITYDHNGAYASEKMAFRAGNNGTHMYLTGDGKLGIGTSTPDGYLTINKNTAQADLPSIRLIDDSDSREVFITNQAGDLFMGTSNSSDDVVDSCIQITTNVIVAKTQNTERMRIESNGEVGIGTTDARAQLEVSSPNLASTRDALRLKNQVTNTGGYFIRFENSTGGVAGYVEQTGQSSVSYTTSSDYRLKENIVDLNDATTRIKQLQPKRFNFITEPNTTLDGFLAHEVQSVVPEAVSGTKDAIDEQGNIKPQGIDQSKLVPLLVKTIQELEARIAALETA